MLPVLACAAALVALGATTRHDARPEETRIRDLDRKWSEAVAARDLDGTVAHYAEDAVFLSPNAPATSGKAAIRAAWKDLLLSPGLSLTFAPMSVRVAHAADMAFEIGSYTMGQDAPGGRVEDDGKYVVVWTRVGGDWKVAADIFNSNRPAAPAPPAPAATAAH
jgi:uncharacterized protein (TIGR02246 family)